MKQVTGVPPTLQPLMRLVTKPSPRTMNFVGSIRFVEPPLCKTRTPGEFVSVTWTSIGGRAVFDFRPATKV